MCIRDSPIAILSGVMSACFNFGLTAGEPIRQAALANGTNALFAKNPVIMFVTLGGFFTNLIYCVFLNVKNKSYKDYLSVSGSVLFNNIFFAMLGGTPVSYTHLDVYKRQLYCLRDD